MPKPHSAPLTVGLVQQSCSEDETGNLEYSMAGIETAAQQGADLVLLQELHRNLYFCKETHPKYFALAEALNGPTAQALAMAAKQHQVVLIGSIFERRAAGVYHNTAMVFERDGSVAGIYRKMHIPDDPGYQEKFYFTPGDGGFVPIQTSIGKLGVMICWDQWYPEAARLMALAGADLLLYPTAIGWDPRDKQIEQQRQLEAWQIVQRSHAVANGLPVLSCNRVGYEADPSQAGNDAQFWGNSFVCGPQGEILAQAGTEPQVLTAQVELSQNESTRQIWPFLRDRRVDAYDAIKQRMNDSLP